MDLPGENRAEILLNNDSQTGRPLPNVIGISKKNAKLQAPNSK